MERTAECAQIRRGLDAARLGSPSGSSLTDGPMASPSAAYQAYLQDIDDAAEAGPDAAGVAQATDVIIASAQTTLTDTLEIYSLTVVAAITDSSAAHWEDDWDNWEQLAVDCTEDPESDPLCTGPPEVDGPLRAWYDWICNSRCRNVVKMDVGTAVGAAVYNVIAGPAGAANVAALAAGGSATQAVIELGDLILE